MVDRLETYIESLIFVAQLPVKREEIRYNLENALQVKIDPDELDTALQHLQEKYWDDNFAIHIVEVAEGFNSLQNLPIITSPVIFSSNSPNAGFPRSLLKPCQSLPTVSLCPGQKLSRSGGQRRLCHR